MEPPNIDTFFPLKFIDTCIPFQILLEKVNRDPEGCLTVLNELVPQLKLGLNHFVPLDPAKVTVREDKITVNGNTFKLSSREKTLVSKLAQALNLEIHLCHQIFKQFVCSEKCPLEWSEYLSCQNQPGSSLELNSTLETYIATEFTIFYFNERTSCIRVLSSVFEKNTGPNATEPSIFSPFVSKFFEGQNESTFLENTLNQLLCTVPRLSSKKSEFKTIQFIRELLVLLELLFNLLSFTKLSSTNLDKFFNWAFSSEIFHSTSGYTSPQIEKEWLRTEGVLFLIFLRLLDIEQFFPEGSQELFPCLFDFPSVLENLIRLTSTASPSNALLVSSVSLFVKYALSVFQKTPPVSDSHKKLLSTLTDVSLTRKIAFSFDFDFKPDELADAVLQRAINFNVWSFFQRILSSSVGSDSMLGSPLLRSFFMGIGFLFPKVISSSSSYFSCLTNMYSQYPQLTRLFWTKDIRHSWRREFLILAQITYPSQKDILPELLLSLMGDTFSTSQSIKYFASLNTLTQNYSSQVSSFIDSVIDAETDRTLVEAIKNIDYFDSVGPTQFLIKEHSRGVLSNFSSGQTQSKRLVWTLNYNGWDFMRCQLENLINSPDPFSTENSDLLLSVEGFLTLLFKAVTKTPKAIRNMFSSHTAELSSIPIDVKVVQHILILCEQCLSIYDPPLKLLELCFNILARLVSTYTSQICNFLPCLNSVYELPNTSSQRSTSLKFSIINVSQAMRNDPKFGPIVLASLDFADAVSGYYLNTAIIHRDLFQDTDALSVFTMTAMKLVLSIHSSFFNWSYSSQPLKFKMGIQILKLLDHFFLSCKSVGSPGLVSIVNLFESECFRDQNHFPFEFVMEIISEGNNTLCPPVEENLEVNSLSTELLSKALEFVHQLLTLFVNPTHTDIRGKALIKSLSRFSDFEAVPSHFLTNILHLINPSTPSLIMCASSKLLTNFINCASKTGLFPLNLQNHFKHELNSQFKVFQQLFELETVDSRVKQGTWHFLANLALSMPGVLVGLIELQSESCLRNDITFSSFFVSLAHQINYWDNQLAKHPRSVAGFSCFLRALWEQHGFFQVFIDRLIKSTKFWDLIARILVSPDKVFSLQSNECAIQINLWKIVAIQIGIVNHSDSKASSNFLTSFQKLVSTLFTSENVNAFLLNGLKLSPQPASIHIINDQLLDLQLTQHSLDVAVVSHRNKMCGTEIMTEENYIYSGAAFHRSIDYIHSNNIHAAEYFKILQALSFANQDMYHAHLLANLFCAQADTFCSVFKTPDAIYSLQNKMTGLSLMMEEFNKVQQALMPFINIHLATKTMELFSSVFANLLSTDSDDLVFDYKLVVDFLGHLLHWRECFTNTSSCSLHRKQVAYFKIAWYQCINWVLVFLANTESFWKTDTAIIESFQNHFITVLEVSSEDITPKNNNSTLDNGRSTHSVSSRIIGALISLFRLESFPPSDKWATNLIDSGLPSVLLNHLRNINFVISSSYCYEIIQLTLLLTKFAPFKKYFIQSRLLLVLSEKKFKPNFSQKTIKSGSHEYFSSLCFTASIEVSTSLSRYSVDIQDELSGQLNAIFLTYVHSIKSILDIVKHFSKKLTFSHLLSIDALAKFMNALQTNHSSSLLNPLWVRLISKLSLLLACLVDYIRSPGALERQVSYPTTFELQLFHRFGHKSWGEYLTEYLPRYQISDIICHVLMFYNSEWNSKTITEDNVTSCASPSHFQLELNCINRVGSGISVGTLLECIAIYSDSLDWIADLFRGANSIDSLSLPQQIQAKAVITILTEAATMLLAQLYLFQNLASPAQCERDLFYDVCQSLASPLSSVRLSLKALSAKFSRVYPPTHDLNLLTSRLGTLWHQTQDYLLQNTDL